MINWSKPKVRNNATLILKVLICCFRKKELSFELKKIDIQNADLKADNAKLKSKVDALYIEVDKLNSELKENATFRIELEPKLENANREIELNKSMLNMLNNEIQMLNSDKLLLEKKLLNTRRNTTPSIIVEEDEEDLEEEKRSDAVEQSHTLDVIHEEENIQENVEAKKNHDRDVEFIRQKTSAISHTDGILILNKQIEDMTFYIDELKSELEAEREKNNEYANEVSCFEREKASISGELNAENERLNKELIDALFKVKEQEKTIKEFELSEKERHIAPPTAHTTAVSKYLALLKEELVQKENFDILGMLKSVDIDGFTEDLNMLFSEFIDTFKFCLQQRDKQLIEESEKVKYTEAQLEKIIKEFKQENEGLEIRLNDKIHDFNILKTQVSCFIDN